MHAADPYPAIMLSLMAVIAVLSLLLAALERRPRRRRWWARRTALWRASEPEPDRPARAGEGRRGPPPARVGRIPLGLQWPAKRDGARRAESASPGVAASLTEHTARKKKGAHLAMRPSVELWAEEIRPKWLPGRQPRPASPRRRPPP
jgi:hypothetical protein